ncbi:DsbE family thiol:disulfide interchange protein [Candidatus Pelagibacter sp.]|nr:DsbE family thiol:disulfide interchange protein [Candidatus Pelagibacter sp.]|tara:strand:- start:348 stop:863 length:516 start_codon:yes stop_codon:yes gene_type:complete
MKIKFSYIFVFLTISFTLLIFFKSLFENKIYIPAKQKNIENISIKEFYSDRNLKIKELFENKKFIVINIWASWCLPCRQEHQYIKNISEIPDLKMIGLNYKDKRDNAQKFLDELGNPFDIILLDPNGTKSIFLGAYGVPETYIIDRELNILRKYIGPINSENEIEIKQLVK